MSHIKMKKHNGWRYRWVLFENNINKGDVRSWGNGQSLSPYIFLNPVRGFSSSTCSLVGNVNTRTGTKAAYESGDVSSGMCFLDGQRRYRSLLPITNIPRPIKMYANIDTRTLIRYNSSSGSIINGYNIVDGNDKLLFSNVQYDQTINLKGMFDWNVQIHSDGWDYYQFFMTRLSSTAYNQKYWLQNIITIHDLVLYL